jgi:sugar-phosphatase
MIKAAVFDLDDLLVSTGPLWEAAFNETFAAVGVPVDQVDASPAIGLRTDEEVDYWHRRYPWRHPSKQVVHDRYINAVTQLAKIKAKAMPGAEQAVKLAAGAGLKLAVASSSPDSVIKVELATVGLQSAFELAYSAEHEHYGKPHPGVYITAARKLGLHPEECLAFEDSINGVLAAKAARMKCVAVPHAQLKGLPGYAIADLVLGSLDDFTPEKLQALI